jgi:outer membrane receptor protein involved in Fe transport
MRSKQSVILFWLKHKILFVLIFCQFTLSAQITIQGVLKDAETDNPLAYATIQAGESNTISDNEGSFMMILNSRPSNLIISYIGYETKLIELSDQAALQNLGTIFLAQSQEELNTVTITSGKFKKRIQDVTVSMEILKPSLIEHNHSTSFDEILDKIPGVNNIDGQVNIRGGAGYSYGAGSRVLLLLDNIPALQSDAAFPNWSDIPIENIAQVEVLKGAGSALYGSAAMNGVINILTSYAKKEASFNIQTQMTGYLAPADSSKQWWDKMPYSFNISSAFSKKIGKLSLVSSVFYTKEESYLKDSYNNYGRIHLKLDYPIKEYIHAGIATNINAGESQSFFYWKNENAEAYQGDTANYGHNNKLRYTLDPYLTYYGADQLTHRFIGRIHGINNRSDNNQSTISNSLYGEYQLQKKWEGLNLVFTSGLVSQFSNVEAELYGDTIFTSQNFAVYVQAEKQFFDRLTVNAGARLETNKIDAPDIVNGIPAKIDSFETKPVYRFGLNYKIFSYTNLRASWGQGYRFPSIAEKYISTTAGILRIIPNPDLQSETGWTSEIGIRQGISLGNFIGFLDASVFQSAYKNMMEFNIKLGTFPPQFTAQNIGNTIIRGLEISTGIQGKIGPVQTNLMGGYVFIDPKFQEFTDIINTLSSSDENILKYRNKHSFKFDLQVEYKILSFGIGSNYLSYMEAIDAAFEAFIPGVKNFRASHMTGTQVWHANLGITINKAWKLSLRMDNIFNEEYTMRPAKLEAPRSISIRLKYKI